MDSHNAHETASPLNIIVIGAGIGGLSAAIGLRQQGHVVNIYEQSKLAQETGAAIHLASNSNGLLRRLGLLVEDIGAVECIGVVEYFPHNAELKYQIDAKKVGDKLWTHPWHLVHRSHLHTALREMATGPGKGTPATLHLGNRVESADPDTASITLQGATQSIQGDLLVGADGVHSRTRPAIPGGDKKPFSSGKSAFRFLIPTETLEADPVTAVFVKRGNLTMWIAEDRRVVMYPCLNNTLMNFVCIHPSVESKADITGEGWQETGSKTRMLEIYKEFHPSVRAIIEKAEEPKVWELLDMEKMPSFINGRLALIGDAAHPFLPHQGQGGGQAIEDAIALAAVLPLGTSASDIPDRLQIYEQCRYERAHKVQEFTRTAGKDMKQLAAEGKKLDMGEYQIYNFCHDSWDYATNALRKHLESQDSATRFRSPLSFGPSPGPRRPLGLDPSSPTVQSLRKSNPETSATYAIRFRSSRTYLQNLLPPGFAFSTPGTLVFASVVCSTLSGMTWLGGGGYSHCGLYIHGVNYTKRDGSKIYGTFLAVLFEDLVDPILTGRDELGMPKLFADIGIAHHGEVGDCTISLGWRGVEFGEFEISKLEKEQPTLNGIDLAEAPQRGPGPPPPPPEQGLFLYRYVPAVGEPGKADAEYAVFVPKPEPAAGAEAPETYVTKTASLKFNARDWRSLPTLHNVAKGLADVPVYGVEEAKLIKGRGVDDVSGARRIE
ncbi:hypothetical protein LTR36_006814 [Oleoguttula mirabilis]|uniref:FAD-binding domain-containing protein n=1 Tax=Oleoguttula mirabilis TaxID=1507867 RepID=A0AAV9JBE0_9PEZI|nr:hypothetical protein LTR36_006814 [Oleoguttula mirabilis]